MTHVTSEMDADMKLEKLIGERFKERPSECVIDSHALMTRGGYIKYVASGIFSSYHVMRRITRKIEQIIREEMDLIDGQEVLFPVALPASLLEESGRYMSIGGELLRFTDRNGHPMVLGMTHEEPAVQLTREFGQSYAKYPFMVYQIQTKFRDEMRPRGGMIRVREFTMKDAYSFHVSQDDLEKYYMRCHRAYERIYARVGIPQAISVASDSGMMGGKVSHEFMLLTPVGEDTIVICKNCDYKANIEAAECIVRNDGADGDGVDAAPLEKVYTPGMKTIENVCKYLKVDIKQSCKAVVYQKETTNEYVVVFLRGDLEINEIKLKNYLGCEIRPAAFAECDGAGAAECAEANAAGGDGVGKASGAEAGTADGSGCESAECAEARAAECEEAGTAGCADLDFGFIGPYNLRAAGLVTLFDNSLKGARNLCCGANETDYHYIGMSVERDAGEAEYDDFAKAKDGGICPACGTPSLEIARGIEVGNIFQLGDKYTKTMNMQFTDANGDSHYPVMGCYGIGVGRLAASVCEARHDEYGPVWPITIAPWQVHICCLRADDANVKEASDKLYRSLQNERIEVICDDRSVSAGSMFSDADLLGAPIRVIVSPRNLSGGCVEIITRDKAVSLKARPDEAVSEIRKLMDKLYSECSAD